MLDIKMSKLISYLLLSITLVAFKLHATPVLIDGVAAIVDSHAILESDIETRFRIIKDRVPGGTYRPDVRRQILNQMIEETLQINYAEKNGIRVNPSEVDNAVLNVADRFQQSLSGFQAMLNQQGIDYPRYRTQIENEILMSKVKTQITRQRISVTEQEIDDFLTSDDALAQAKEEVHLRHLILRSDSTSEKDIQEIFSKINNEQDFIEQAIAQSEDQYAVQGGDIGWRALNQLPVIFSRALRTSEGPLIGPLESNAGQHLIWLMDKRVPQSEIQKQTRVRHILIRPNEVRTQIQAKALIDDLYQQIKGGADFDELAKESSEDPGSALKGGDLDWVVPGAMVPAFEDVMNRTDVGKMSQPFQTQFGWHILLVEGRRDADISQELQRSNAEKALIKQKQDFVLSNWLDELKSQAFIEIK